jgi:single-stranded DNA-binding protein
MARNMLQTMRLIGRVASIEELKQVNVGSKAMDVLHFSVAVNSSRRLGVDNALPLRPGEKLYTAPDGSEYAQSTLWMRVTCWNGHAEAMARLLGVGDLVQVEGEMAFELETGGPRAYVDRDGYAAARFEMSRDVQIDILHRAANGNGANGNGQGETEAPAEKPKAQTRPRPSATGDGTNQPAPDDDDIPF